MSSGLPIIASNFPLLKQIIEDVGCGLLVDPMDTKAIAKAMRWILDNPSEAEAMGKRGRQAVLRIYNWDAEAVKLINLYNKVLNKS
jgi:glycosyltransferase involved in cell wall biosynthesis